MKSIVIFALVLVVTIACNDTTPIVPASVQLERDIAIIDEYLAANNITAIQDTTGVRYVITQLGIGDKPSINDCVRVSYIGKLLSDGTVFDESTSYKSPLRSFIAGWQIAFPLLPRGSKATLYIPSGYAYGSRAAGSIPANAILVFDVELFEIYAYNSVGSYCYDDPILPEAEQNGKDAVIIDNYLVRNNITAQTDPSGLRYVVQSLGTGVKPTLSNCVRVSYTGKLIPDGSTFDQSTNFKGPLKKLIKGWQVGLPLFPKGSKVTLYVPSRMAYGPQSQGSKLPANANVMFDIEILDVTDYNATADICN